MATFVNDRYTRLQATTPRFVSPPAVKKLDLRSTTLLFKFTAGTPEPASATLTANLLGITGVATWTITGGVLTGSADNVRYIDASSLTGQTATITATIVDGGVSYPDTVTLIKVTDGTIGNDGLPGARGAGQYFAIGSAWDDAVANTATPGGNVTDDQVTIANGIVTYTKRWTGSAWAVPGSYLSGDLFVEKGIHAASIDTNGLEINTVGGTPILTVTGLQEGFEAPGTRNVEAQFSPFKTWEFRSTLDGWNASGATTTTAADTLTLTSTGGDPTFSSPTVSVNGALYNKIRMRVRRVAGSAWQGQIYYSNGVHGSSESYTKNVPDTTSSLFRILEWDMSALTAGGSDWISNTTTSIRIDLGNSSSDVFEIDWITIGKYAPVQIGDLGFIGDLNANNTTNTNQLTDGAGLGATALWSNIAGQTNAPANNATVGAPSGTNVGTTPATTVESNAANGQNSYAAINDSATGLAARLRNNAANVLAGGAGIGIGSLTWNSSGARTGGYGVGITSFGLLMYNSSGVPTFVANASTGALAVLADISGSTGTFGDVIIGTKLYSGMTAWGVGSGIWMENIGGVVKVAFGDATNYMRWSPSGGLELKQNVFSATALTSINSSGSNGTRTLGTRTLTTSNGVAPITYNWSLSFTDTNNTGGVLTFLNADTDTVTVKGTGTNTQISGRLVGTATGNDGRSVTVSCNVLGTFGTPP